MTRTLRYTFFVSVVGFFAAAGLLAADALPSSRTAQADPSLVARWHMDELDPVPAAVVEYTTPDSSGNGYTATLGAGVTLAAGKWGNALQLAAPDGGVAGARVIEADSHFAPQTLTVLAWVKRSGSPGQNAYLVAKGAQDCVAASYALSTGPNGGLVFYAKVGQSVAVSPDAGQRIWDGNWHAVAGTFDGNTARLFVDGSEVGTGTPAQGSIDYAAADLSGDLSIGYYVGGRGCTGQYTGQIDEVELYGRALSADEIRWLETGGGANPPELPPPAPPATTHPPIASLSAATRGAVTGRVAALDPSASRAGSAAITDYLYDVDGSKRFAVECPTGDPVLFASFATPGPHVVGLRVVDANGQHADTYTTITTLRAPGNIVRRPPLSWCGTAASIRGTDLSYLPLRFTSDVRAVGIDVTQGIVLDLPPKALAKVRAGSIYKVEQDPAANQLPFLQKGGKTIVRVYASAVAAPFGDKVTNVQMLLSAKRTGAGPVKLLGPLLSETGPLDVPLGPPFTTHGMRISWNGAGSLPAFTFTLPDSWTRGTLKLFAQPILVGPRLDRMCATDACKNAERTSLDGVKFQNTGTVIVRSVAMSTDPAHKDLPDPATALDGTLSISPVALVPTPYQATVGMDALKRCQDNPNGTLPKFTRCSDSNGTNAFALGRLGYWVDNNKVPISPLVKYMTVGIHTGYGDVARGQTIGLNYGDCSTAKQGDPCCPWGPSSILCETVDQTPYSQVDLLSGRIGSTPRPLSAVAHEIFHGLGRPHADAAAQPPGCGGGAGGVAAEGRPDAKGHIQGIGLDRHAGSGGSAQTPYKLISPDISGEPSEWFDFMSYCTGGSDGPTWISAYNWVKTALDFVSFLASQGASSDRKVSGVETVAAGPALSVVGYADASGTHIVSIEPASGSGNVPRSSVVTAVVRDGAGRVVGKEPLYAATGHSDSQGTGRPPGLVLSFSGTVPARDASKLQIQLNGSVVATAARSAHAPAVKLVSPLTGTIGRTSAVPIRWLSSDRDGGSLTALVDYSGDGGRTWRTVYEGASSRSSLSLPGSYFTGSADARIRIRVSDGFNQTTVVSGRLHAVGHPPAVTISSPKAGERFQADASVYLSAYAFDDAFRLLPGPYLRWYVGKRLLGVGTAVTATDLPPGHVAIRLVATDSHGRATTKTVPVAVVPARPFFVTLSAPRHLDRSANAVRLRVATNVTATLLVAGRKVVVGPHARDVVVHVKPGRAAFRLQLTLVSHGLTSAGTVLITRR